MLKERIEISAKQKRDLRNEFKVSKPTVQYSLDYVFNSPTAIAIRSRAKEMLQAEIEKINVNP